MSTQTIKSGPEKESKDKPVTEPIPRTNKDADKEDPRKIEKKNLEKNLKAGPESSTKGPSKKQ